jgi:endo-1,4-beta-D-glucanase Y
MFHVKIMSTVIKYPLPLKPSKYSLQQLHDTFSRLYQELISKNLRNYQSGSYLFYNDGESTAPSQMQTVSEAQGFLMMLSCMAGDKTTFDKALIYFKLFKNNKGLMGWQQALSNGNLIPSSDGGTDSATDGDLDICMALELAWKKWGDVGYGTEFASILSAIKKYNVTSWNILNVGDWNTDGSLTRSSDFMLLHLLQFQIFDKEFADVYLATIKQSVATCNLSSPLAGIFPDFFQVKNGVWNYPNGKVLEDTTDGSLSYNACRTYMRMYHNYMPQSLRDIFVKANNTFKKDCGGNPGSLHSGFDRSGKGLGGADGDIIFVSQTLLTCLIAKDQVFLDAVYDYVVAQPTASNDYYGNCVRLMCLAYVCGMYEVIV